MQSDLFILLHTTVGNKDAVQLLEEPHPLIETKIHATQTHAQITWSPSSRSAQHRQHRDGVHYTA